MALTQVQGGMILASGQSIPKAALPTGSVLQVVQATYTTYPNTTTSTSFVGTGHTVTITPNFSTSKILLITHHGTYNTTGTGYRTIYRNSTNIGDASWGFNESSSSGGWETNAIVYLDSPATTSSTSYQIYFRTSAGTTYYGADSGQISSLIAMEIAA